MFPPLTKLILLIIVIYVARQAYRSLVSGRRMSGGQASGRQASGRQASGRGPSRFSAGAYSAGRVFRQAQGSAAAPAQKVTVDLVRCDRCAAFVSQPCSRPDCRRR